MRASLLPASRVAIWATTLPAESAVSSGPPIQLLNKDDLGAPRDSWDVPTNYAEQFEKLWKV